MAVIGVASITPAFPVIVEELKITKTSVGLLITVFSVPGIFLAPFIGMMRVSRNDQDLSAAGLNSRKTKAKATTKKRKIQARSMPRIGRRKTPVRKAPAAAPR